MAFDLKPCPFCGFKPEFEDGDCCYPVALDRKGNFSLFGLHCYSTGGGCGAQVIGRTPKDCVEAWNKRVGDNDE